MDDHIIFIKKQVVKTYETIIYEIKNYPCISDQPLIYNITAENFKLINQTNSYKKIHRIYVYTKKFNNDYYKLGWVLDDDINQCMSCYDSFIGYVYNYSKHHCRACGNIICNKCCISVRDIVNLNKIKFQQNQLKICCNCYWGQENIELNIIDIERLQVLNLTHLTERMSLVPNTNNNNNNQSKLILDKNLGNYYIYTFFDIYYILFHDNL